ncbi:Neurogenic locus notch protein [Echinococcus granulosus]|uniref:Delta-like protein n=1 Tax=Echinococcus granulosus TaxID=6210 RepID=W6UGN1_ECHGR|nr:Neurogenic locus notch protein [Echinococcus granulosus]EUB60141.1 Neurogenic locus notch protein [Echinococcus granulosus]
MRSDPSTFKQPTLTFKLPSSFERRLRRSRRSTSHVSHYNVVGAAKKHPRADCASHQISAQLRHMYFFRSTKAYHAEVENQDTCLSRSGSLSAATNVASRDSLKTKEDTILGQDMHSAQRRCLGYLHGPKGQPTQREPQSLLPFAMTVCFTTLLVLCLGLHTTLSLEILESLSIEVAVYDFDKFSGADLIGRYELEVLGSTKDYFSTLSGDTKNDSKPGLRVDMRLQLNCSENFYGSRCETYCKSDGLSYYCSPSGERICLRGFFGEFCNVTDVCTREPCAYGATCVPKSLGRICVCNGGHYPECYPLTDPCRFSPCRNGGVCDRSPTNPLGFVCTCPRYYTGVYCEQRLSLCALLETDQRAAQHIASKMVLKEEEQKGGFGMSTPVPSVCLNGGVCVDHPTKFTFFCSCPEGWTGSWCETKIAEASAQSKLWQEWLVTRVIALHDQNALVYETPLRSTHLSVGHASNESCGTTAKLSTPGSSYEPIMPCLGDSLNIHRPQTDVEDNEEKPPLPLRTPLLVKDRLT